MRTLKLHEVGKHACGPVFMLTMGHTTVVNLDTWKKIPPDLQKTILETAKDTEKFYLEHLKKTEQADQDSLKAAGTQLVRLPAADLQTWKGKSPDFLAAWVNDMKGKGFGKEADQIAQQIKAILSR
jgi:TRAP-type C4-dicarboxylate transport system substrate-binding protein